MGNETITPDQLAVQSEEFLKSLFKFSGWVVDKIIGFLQTQNIPFFVTPERITAMAILIDAILIIIVLKFASKLRPIIKVGIILLLLYIGMGFFV